MKQELMPLSKKILRVGFNLGALLFIVLGKLVCIIINVEMCLRREVELWSHFFWRGEGASASESRNNKHNALRILSNFVHTIVKFSKELIAGAEI